MKGIQRVKPLRKTSAVSLLLGLLISVFILASCGGGGETANPSNPSLDNSGKDITAFSFNPAQNSGLSADAMGIIGVQPSVSCYPMERTARG